MPDLFCVRFRRPDGRTLYLGPVVGGAAANINAAWRAGRAEAELAARERNELYGPRGYEYWVEPVTESEGVQA